MKKALFLFGVCLCSACEAPPPSVGGLEVAEALGGDVSAGFERALEPPEPIAPAPEPQALESSRSAIWAMALLTALCLLALCLLAAALWYWLA